jgi:hypothetical protein
LVYHAVLTLTLSVMFYCGARIIRARTGT